MYRDFQTRLQTKHDRIKQKLLDNAIELMGQITDCIRLRLNKNDEGDIISRTIIKMDVEGFEFETLKGAETIIRSLKPKLAICIYHKTLDFYEIPLYLKSLVPEYKFKVRQHEPGFCETVLYAYL